MAQTSRAYRSMNLSPQHLADHISLEEKVVLLSRFPCQRTRLGALRSGHSEQKDSVVKTKGIEFFSWQRFVNRIYTNKEAPIVMIEAYVEKGVELFSSISALIQTDWLCF